MTLDDVIRRHVLVTLAVFDGNRSAAARALGIARSSLQRMLKRWSPPPKSSCRTSSRVIASADG